MERIALRIFFTCMPITAVLVLFGIWFGERLQPPEWIFQIAGTAFVLGLASFLTWFVCVARKSVTKDEKENTR